jgi:RNA-directed DNA polymerase
MMRDSTGTIGTMLSLPSNHLTYSHVLDAYYAARRSKRSAICVLEWEYDYESRCFALYEELISGSYIQDIRHAFIVRDPVWREIIVPSFRDRVVHHLIGMHLVPLLDHHYIYDTYAGRLSR